MRMGIHSGPVTAGVLRGEKSRFQLFGGMYVSMDNEDKQHKFIISLCCIDHLLTTFSVLIALNNFVYKKQTR